MEKKFLKGIFTLITFIFINSANCALKLISPPKELLNTFPGGKIVAECLNCAKLLNVINTQGRAIFVNSCQQDVYIPHYENSYIVLTNNTMNNQFFYNSLSCDIPSSTSYYQFKGAKMIILPYYEQYLNMSHNFEFEQFFVGEDLMVPVILIRNEDLKSISNYYEKNNNEQLLLEIDKKLLFSDKVTLDIDYPNRPNSRQIFSILDGIFYQEVANKLIEVNIHFPTIEYRSNAYHGCFCQDKYCSLDIEFPVEDFLIQKCVQNFANSPSINNQTIFVYYMNIILSSNSYGYQLNLMDYLGIPFGLIHNCVIDSFDPKTNYTCTNIHTIDILKKDLKNNFTDVSFHQAYNIKVNGRINFDSSGNYLKDLICAILAEKKTSGCSGYYKQEVDEDNGYLALFIIIITIIITINIVIYCICRRYLARRVSVKLEDQEIADRVNNTIFNYSPFREKS